jgi:hypothetical protein
LIIELMFYEEFKLWSSSEWLGFWTLSIARSCKYWKTQCFRLQVRGRRHLLCWVPYKNLTSVTKQPMSCNNRLALCKVPNRVDVSLSSPEDRNRSSFRNDMFSSV